MPRKVTLKSRRIVILGSPDVGKSSLVQQFVENRFSGAYHPSLDNTFTKTITYNGTDYSCELIDTAGQHEFSQLNWHHVLGTHGFVLVYSIASAPSFDMVQIIYDKILNFSGLQKIPAVIVGSKADLDSSRKVDSLDGERSARLNNAEWLETSALRNENVAQVFQLCLAEIEKANAPPPPQDKNRCTVM